MGGKINPRFQPPKKIWKKDTRKGIGACDSVGTMDKRTQSQNAFDPVGEWLRKSDEFARREPTKAVASALGAGFLINLLPIAAIAGALVAVLFAMARPVLLFLGLMKAFEFCRPKTKTNP